MTEETKALQFLHELENSQIKKQPNHLTDEQRAIVCNLFATCNHKELLLCVAGIVTHSEPDYTKALMAGDLIRKAARTITPN